MILPGGNASATFRVALQEGQVYRAAAMIGVLSV